MALVESLQRRVVRDVEVVVMVGQVLADIGATDQVRVHQHTILFILGYEPAPDVSVVIINQAVSFVDDPLLDRLLRWQARTI